MILKQNIAFSLIVFKEKTHIKNAYTFQNILQILSFT